MGARRTTRRGSGGLNVAGYFKAELGVGEVARLVASAARAEGIPVATVVNDQTLSRQDDTLRAGREWRAVCRHARVRERRRVSSRRGRAATGRWRENCHRIGFWFWETEQLPSAYQPASDLLDEVWVATDYVAAAVRPTVSKPVHICPMPDSPPGPRAREPGRPRPSRGLRLSLHVRLPQQHPPQESDRARWKPSAVRFARERARPWS